MRQWACVVLAFLTLTSKELLAGPPISSPEGTATSYVSEKGPFVYAPRAARAQKVVFDTSDKQLIYAPDTPFRRFFESHAPDFDPNQQDYAKTTILGDVIAMLRSKAYIRDIIADAVENHKQTAISDECPSQKALKVGADLQKQLAAISKIENTKGIAGNAAEITLARETIAQFKLLASAKKSNAAQLQKLADAIQKADKTLEQYGKDAANLPKPPAAATPEKTAPAPAPESVTKVASAAVAAPAPEAAGKPAAKELATTMQQDAKKLSDEIGSILTNPETLQQAKQECTNSEKWRDNHAELLTDYLFLEFQKENYPDMEDGEIDEVVTNRFAHSPVAAHALGELDSRATQAFAIELAQRLKQRDWLRKVLDHAIANRADLFKKTGSPVQNLRDTEDAFSKLIETRLFSAALTQSLKNDSTPLWQAFLTHLDSDSKAATNRYLLQPANNRDRAMDKDELRNFGKDLRQELLANGKSPAGALDMAQIKKALGDYLSLSSNAAFLCPEFNSGQSAAQLEQSERAFWSKQLAADLKIGDALRTLTNSIAGTNAAEVTAGVTNLLAAIQASLEKINKDRAADDRIETPSLVNSVTNRAAAFLKPYVDKKNKIEQLKQEEMAADSVLDKMPLSTARARQRLISDFETVFNNALPLISSDDPLLKTFLGSDQVKYSIPDFRKKAVTQIPPLFYKQLGTGDNSTNLAGSFKAVLNDPEISFLFGQGSGNPQVVEAFKQEFCAAFQDKGKLQEAIKAEREADYDYWWFTFYPKAIPYGSKRLQGASIIEIGFPESVIPEVQYHRWLQDTSLGDGESKGANRKVPPGTYAPRDQRSGLEPIGEPGELIQDIRLRNATTLLRDMLNVLESSELKSQFGEVRPMMIRVLDEFTNAKFSEDERYRHGIRALYEEVFPEDKDWLRALASIVDQNGLTNGILNKKLGLAQALDLGSICQETNSLSLILDDLALQVPVQWSNPDWHGLPRALAGRRDTLGFANANPGNTVAAGDKALLLVRHYLDEQFDALIKDTKREIRSQFSELEAEPGGERGDLEETARRIGKEWEQRLVTAKQDARLLIAQKFPSVWAQACKNCPNTFSNQLYEAANNRFRSDVEVLPSDFIKFTNLVTRLRGKIGACEVIFGKLDCTNRTLIADTNASFESIQSKLAKGLTTMVNGASLYNESWPKGLLSEELKTLGRGKPQADQLRYLNRRILEAALPDNLMPANDLRGELEKKIKGELAPSKFPKVNRSVLQERGDELVDHLQNRLVACLQNTSEYAAKKICEARDSLDEIGKYPDCVKQEVRSFAIDFYLRQTSEQNVRDGLRRKLKDIDFDKLHVLFSVYAVTETRARLPEKVNLFLWAQAQGVMLFQHPFDELATNALLNAHTSNFWHDAQPSRGDAYCGIEKIPTNSVAAMQAEAELYGLILNSYFSSYPDVPSKESIREGYFANNHDRLMPIVYDWLDDSGVLYQTNAPNLKNRFVDEAAFLTPKAQHLLFQSLERNLILPMASIEVSTYRLALSNVVHQIFSDPGYLPLARELDETLFDNYYKTLWQMLAMIEETERHAVPYDQIHHGDYSTFRSWGRPTFQKGIQIVEMLPESRDDLVSMSVNEGGVVAKLAGQAEGSAAYDLNELQMAARATSSTGSQLQKLLASRQDTTAAGTDPLKEVLGQNSSSGSQQIFKDLSQLGKSSGSQGYSLGAAANGSIYARAKASLAYSRRREYLDAAITSAGRGDNYAKWVVRTSDLRSNLAAGSGKKNVAAAHSGFPNGDQPFYLLVKVPRRANHTDWYGRNYIHFNSTYVATSRVSVWQDAGFAGLIAKVPFGVMNPHWWTEIEEGLVGTQYPFMWNVRGEQEQNQLLRAPNLLGGAIWLDDTDKIKYSDIQDMINAEDNFIRMTREAQTSDLNTVMGDIQKESGEFQGQVRKNLTDRMQASEKALADAQSSTNLTIRMQNLETNLAALKTSINNSKTNKTASGTQ